MLWITRTWANVCFMSLLSDRQKHLKFMTDCILNGAPISTFDGSPLEEKLSSNYNMNKSRGSEGMCAICYDDQSTDSDLAIFDWCGHSICPTCVETYLVLKEETER